VLMRELQSLCLDIQVEEPDAKEPTF
jgi:hypothetical protein